MKKYFLKDGILYCDMELKSPEVILKKFEKVSCLYKEDHCRFSCPRFEITDNTEKYMCNIKLCDGTKITGVGVR